MFNDNDLLLKQAMSVNIMDVLNHYEIPIYGRKINCLWHDDKTPSAHIYEDTNVGYCFACSRANFNSIDIVKLKEDMTFPEAIDFLVNKFEVNENFVFKQKRNLNLYYVSNDEYRQMIKDGEDIEMIRHYCQLVDMMNDQYKILLNINGTIKSKISNKKRLLHESKKNVSQEKI